MAAAREVTLHYADNRSDKIYKLLLVATDTGGWECVALFGRRGGALQKAEKTSRPVPRAAAEAVFDATLREKVAKGYRVISDTDEARSGSALQDSLRPGRPAAEVILVCPKCNVESRQLGDGSFPMFALYERGSDRFYECRACQVRARRQGSAELAYAQAARRLELERERARRVRTGAAKLVEQSRRVCAACGSRARIMYPIGLGAGTQSWYCGLHYRAAAARAAESLEDGEVVDAGFAEVPEPAAPQPAERASPFFGVKRKIVLED